MQHLTPSSQAAAVSSRYWSTLRLVACRLTVPLALAACAHHAPELPTPAAQVRVALVDSIPWKTEEESGFLRRVELRFAGAVDTIPRVLTAELPVVVGARVLGFAYKDDGITGAFEYDAEHKLLKWDTLPPDFSSFFSAPSLAADGRHIVYIVEPGNDSAWAVVRTWPGGAVVWRSGMVEVPATDFVGGNATRWLTPDTAEVFIESGPATGVQWSHMLGSVRQARVLRADTVRQTSNPGMASKGRWIGSGLAGCGWQNRRASNRVGSCTM